MVNRPTCELVMEAEEDLFTFLKTRNIPESVISQLIDDQIDINVINVMTDEELGQYIVRYGDRLALRAFCRQKTVTNERSRTGEVTTVKSALMQKIRDRLRGKEKTPDAKSEKASQFVGNRHAAKDTRRVEMGWLHSDESDFHQVRTKNGGGTQHLSVQKTVAMGELLETGKRLFFPNGRSSRGPIEDFEFDIRLFSHTTVPLETTVQQLYEQTNLRMRIYTCSRKKQVSPKEDSIVLSDSSSDFEPTDNRPVKTRRKLRQSLRTKTQRYNRNPASDQQEDQPDGSSDSDLISFGLMDEGNNSAGEPSWQAGPSSPQMCNTEILNSVSLENIGSHARNHESEDDSLIHESNEDADQLIYGRSDSSVTLALQESDEDSEVRIGPVSAEDDIDQDPTLLWNPHDLSTMQQSSLNDGPATSHSLPESPVRFEKEIRCVTLRRVNIVQDVLNIFMDPQVLNVNLKMEITNEKAVDSDGVSREVYSAFWEHFLEQCEGEDERVPRLRPDYSEKEWEATGRVWLKGYLDRNIIPIRLSPSFILACCQGVSAVDEELLMMSFLRFLSVSERASVEKALQGNMDETDEEDLLDLFSRMGSHNLPSKDNIHGAIIRLAQKALLQEPKFIIDCFHSVIYSDLSALISGDNIMELYESKRPTNKKVAQMIKPSVESLNQQEQSALNYLIRYVRSIDQRKLEIFLRFCTGSTVLCKDTIEVTFNQLCGLGRRLVAHTCGAVLELPCTYNSYPEFRAELDGILSGDCFTMDIV